MTTGFSGVFTAIVTPFEKNGDIDWAAFEILVERQIEGGVSGIVPCGTTGESPTLSESEQLQVIANTVRLASGRCAVIAGTGSNNTAHACEMTKAAQGLGADGVLVVNPYYNKPTQEGLYRHFAAVAASTTLPVMVYNIKGRTGVNVETPTLERLWNDCANITSVKEASGDLEQMKAVIQRKPAHFSVLSGDDNLTLPLIRAGGAGVVSVASNAAPKQMVSMVSHALAGEWKEAEALEKLLQPFFEAIFIETNPIPIKAVLSAAGLCQEIYRLPLCEMRPENKKKLEAVVKELTLR